MPPLRASPTFARFSTFEGRVHLLDSNHRFVDQLADDGLLGAGLQVRPVGVGWYPDYVFGEVCVGVFCVIRIFCQQRLTLQLEPIRDVLEEDQTKRDMLVIRGLHVATQLVGGLEQAGFNAEVGTVVD
jgi:hypothetical protein